MKNRAPAFATILLAFASADKASAQDGRNCYALFDAGMTVTTADDLRRILDSEAAGGCPETTDLLELRLEALSASDTDPEARLFNSAVSLNSSRELEAYKQQYPEGRFAALATRMQQRLQPRVPRG